MLERERVGSCDLTCHKEIFAVDKLEHIHSPPHPSTNFTRGHTLDLIFKMFVGSMPSDHPWTLLFLDPRGGHGIFFTLK